MRPFLLALAALAVLLPLAQAARADQATDDADAIASCMTDAWPQDARALCVGVVSAPCQLKRGDESTKSMNICLTREAEAWNAVMERQIPELERRAREVDAANKTKLDLDSAVETLENAQRAWLIYRDAECRFAKAIWGAGGFRAVARAACMLDLTARRAVDFYARLATGG